MCKSTVDTSTFNCKCNEGEDSAAFAGYLRISEGTVKIYKDWTTDELLDELPQNLHLARNDNAPEHDRWRVYNMATGKYPEPGYATARECLIGTLTVIENQRKAWLGIEYNNDYTAGGSSISHPHKPAPTAGRKM